MIKEIKEIRIKRLCDELFQSYCIERYNYQGKTWICVDDIMIGICDFGSLCISLWFKKCLTSFSNINPSILIEMMEIIIAKLFNSDKFTINYIY